MTLHDLRDNDADHGAPGRASAQEFLEDALPWSPENDVNPSFTMSCDVEDYFQVSAFEGLVMRDRWTSVESRIGRNVDRALQILSDSGDQATFFTLGWVAQNLPEVVRRIAAEGHEVASHGMEHRRIWEQSPDEFRADVSDTRKLLEDVSGAAVTGYRAASWSLDGRSPWAHGVLEETGYRYSSSIYPVSHDHFGVPGAPLSPFYVNGGDFLEIPATAVRVFGRNMPAAGGGYFRLYPMSFSRWLIRQVQAENRPFVFYFHPWELDPSQPRFRSAPLRAKLRHYLNLDKFEGRLRGLLNDHRWERMDRVFLGNDTAC
jgi:polysaccharide deacetylase family protein (PEP-CTERM system associated)